MASTSVANRSMESFSLRRLRRDVYDSRIMDLMKNYRAALVALVALVALAPASAQDWFGAPKQFVSVDPVRLVLDVDADGDLDLVRVAPSGGGAATFTVMANTGNADFIDAPPVSFPTGVDFVVASGEVTGDGRPDILFATTQAYSAGPGFLVFPGSPSGTFGAPTHESVPGTVVKALHLADVTGDGVLDVGVWDVNATQGAFSWHPSLGGGIFATWPGVTIPVMQLHVNHASLALDTNGDGITDVAIAEPGSLRFCPTIGNASVIGPSHPIATTAGIDAFAAGDLDGDGDVDILYSGPTPHPTFPTASNANLVRIMNQGGGTWSAPVQQTFQAPLQYYTTGARLLIGHWDNDGQPDVVLTTARVTPTSTSLALIRIFSGSASGSLALGLTVLAWEVDPAGVGIFDMSGDGIPDLVGGFEILFGVGGMTSPFGQLAGGVATGNPRDWDDDGDLDFASNTSVAIYSANDGRGVFAPVQLTLPPPPPGLLLGVVSLAGDFNGDRRPDWLVGFQTPPAPPSFPFGMFSHHSIYSDAGNGTLLDLGVASVGGISAAFQGKQSPVLDVNGDGFDDILGQYAMWFSNGAGTLTAGASYGVGSYPMAAADADADSDVDILVSNWTVPTANVSLLRNTGGGAFISTPIDTGSSVLADGRLADLDDDGDVDVLLGYGTVFVATGSTVHVIENVYNSGFVTHQLTFPVLGALQLVVSSVDAGDVDGDGNTDLVLGLSATYSGPPLVTSFAVLRRVGPGLTYETPRLFAAPSFARLADLDGDGDLDVTGQSFLFNRRFVNPAAGSSRQYGAGSPGTGGIVPILGRSGPLRPGLFAGIRVRRALGATSGVLVVGAAQSAVTYPGLPGIVSYAEPWSSTLPLVIAGTPGQPGGGLSTGEDSSRLGSPGRRSTARPGSSIRGRPLRSRSRTGSRSSSACEAHMTTQSSVLRLSAALISLATIVAAQSKYEQAATLDMRIDSDHASIHQMEALPVQLTFVNTGSEPIGGFA